MPSAPRRSASAPPVNDFLSSEACIHECTSTFMQERPLTPEGGIAMSLRVELIYFTQSHVWDAFSNRSSIVETIESILRGEMDIGDFPPIRVAKKNGVYWSIDNRRLFVLRHCGVLCTNVLLYDWNTPLSISEEFHGKYHNGLGFRNRGLCAGGQKACVRQRRLDIPFPRSNVMEDRGSDVRNFMHDIEQEAHYHRVQSFLLRELEVKFIIVRGHARGRRAFCAHCPFSDFRNADCLREHERVEHTNCFSCTCGRTFRCSEDLRRHSRSNKHLISIRYFCEADEQGPPTTVTRFDSADIADQDQHDEEDKTDVTHGVEAEACDIISVFLAGIECRDDMSLQQECESNEVEQTIVANAPIHKLACALRAGIESPRGQASQRQQCNLKDPEDCSIIMETEDPKSDCHDMVDDIERVSFEDALEHCDFDEAGTSSCPSSLDLVSIGASCDQASSPQQCKDYEKAAFASSPEKKSFGWQRFRDPDSMRDWWWHGRSREYFFEEEPSLASSNKLWYRFRTPLGKALWWWCEDGRFFFVDSPGSWKLFQDPHSLRHWWWLEEGNEWFFDE